MSLHILDEFELGAGAFKIVIGMVDFEIPVPADVVGQKAHTAFQRHQDGGKG